MKKSRKAQFYLFTAVVLSVVAFTLVKPKETSIQKDETFAELYQNYIKEASKAADNALLESVNLKTRFEDFNNDFSAYSNSRNIKFGFLGILSSNETIVHNKLNDDVELSYLTTTETLNKGNIDSIDWSEQLLVEYGDMVYTFDFTEGLTEVKGIFYAKSSNYEKFYVYN